MSISIYIAGSFLQVLILGVLCLLILECPHIYVIGGGTSQLHSSVLTEHIQSLFQILRIYIGSSLDGSDSTVFEFYNSHTDVLGLQIMMELLSGHTIDLIYLISEHPAKKVGDEVDAVSYTHLDVYKRQGQLHCTLHGL